MENLERLLREHEFLKGLSEAHLGLMVACAKNLRFEAGEFLMREGGEANTFFLLRVGRVALEVHVPGRGTLQMESVGPGDVLGLSWLVPPYRVSLDARAVEPVVALAFDGACLRGKIEKDHELGYELVRRLYEKCVQRLDHVRLQRLDVYQAP
jgi:CRP/FNR family transcriptional regulator, cyclic AMP receptor protein